MTNVQRSIVWILITLAFTAAMCLLQGICVNVAGAEHTLGIAVLLFAAAYLLRKTRFGMIFQTVGLWSCFILVLVYTVRIVATTARPYADPLLSTIDLGTATAIFQWSKKVPFLDACLTSIYNSTYVQTEFAVLYLALSNQKPRMDALLLRFILATLLTLIGFYCCPAQGTVFCGLPVPNGYGEILVELDRLRSGVTSIGGPQTTALITFPSFHTVSAVLLISVYHRSCLFRPMLILNSLMVLSTLTAGMHYAVDVIAGLAIAAVVIASTKVAASCDSQKALQSAHAPVSGSEWAAQSGCQPAQLADMQLSADRVGNELVNSVEASELAPVACDSE